MDIVMTESQYEKYRERLSSTLPKYIKEAESKLSGIFIKDIDKLIKKSINQFYESYSPRDYDRKYALKYMYNLTPNGANVHMEFGGEFAGECHRLPNEYIFDLVFEQGWHGGAPSGEGHPDPGTPYWRTPKPYYPEWGAMAAPSQAPMDIIDNALDAYYVKGNEKIASIIAPILEKWINDALDYALRRR